MAYVFKIKCGDVLRRVTIPQQQDSPYPDITLIALESKIRDLFDLDYTTQVVITYTDRDGDNVTIGDESDLIDACVNQSLNPLRLFINTTADVNPPRKPELGNNNPSSSMDSANLEGLLPNAAVDGIKQLLTVLPSLAMRKALDGSMKVLKEAQASVETFDNNMKGKKCSEKNDDRNRDFQYHNPPQEPAETVLLNMEECWTHHNIHRNIQCDACRTTPIVGMRYKSVMRENYDLCSNCFKQIGNPAEYQQIEWPQSDCPFCSARPHAFHPFDAQKMMWHNPMHPHPFVFQGPPGLNLESSCWWGPPVNGNAGKLDARFVRDVSIFDGMEIYPMTRFTKIWRFRNIGTTPFPSHTQLVHVEGHKLGPIAEVSLQLPEQGLPVAEEIDVSADLISPEYPGRYISYWRLRAPSGHKFGQKVWVMIQVVTQRHLSPLMKDLLLDEEENSGGVSALRSPQEGEMEANSQQGTVMAILKPVSANKSKGDSGIPDLPLSDDVSLNNGGVESNFAWDFIPQPARERTLEAIESESLLSEGMSQPEADGNEVETETETEPPLNVKSLKENMEGLDDSEACLDQLESMGFTLRTINLELLLRNNNDLQKTIENLVATSAWEPFFHSLEEMGFNDKDTNIRLMLKNNGDVKRAVKDLVEIETSAGINSASF